MSIRALLKAGGIRILDFVMLDSLRVVFLRGGPVMWPLLAMSVVAVALIVERGIFWLRTRGPGRGTWVLEMCERLRQGDETGARAIATNDRTLYGSVVRTMLGLPAHDSLAVELVERHRRMLERYSGVLSTCITAAPLLGILGTVTGIISSFDLLGRAGQVVEIELVAAGIAEALITTVFGLVITLVVLFPYLWIRSKMDGALGDIEMMSAARLSATKRAV